MLLCVHCKKEVKNQNSQRQHEIRCKSNPNAIIVKSSYGMLGKIGKRGINHHGYGITRSKETKAKISEASKKQIWSEERRRKHSESMKLAVTSYPNSYTSSNRGRTKQIEKHGIKFQGKWELEFYEWCLGNSILITRCDEWFSYEFDGIRKYNPDFYLPNLDLYVEVKGYQTSKDDAKWNQFPKKLCIIKLDEIKKIRHNSFSGPVAQG